MKRVYSKDSMKSEDLNIMNLISKEKLDSLKESYIRKKENMHGNSSAITL